ncbi:hypothetical protein M514_01688 [Trichuris suis]|uniref:Uncharacterized protein n=1 Tax=Trichuris suis TaxID=68888 RepID=A0A085N5X7_9BILA|nr:hypothetical protein M513_01688 [Trichuris suis]KFD64873.1 hypothetical protein M514_01688 [Trichuris suis]
MICAHLTNGYTDPGDSLQASHSYDTPDESAVAERYTGPNIQLVPSTLYQKVVDGFSPGSKI